FTLIPLAAGIGIIIAAWRLRGDRTGLAIVYSLLGAFIAFGVPIALGKAENQQTYNAYPFAPINGLIPIDEDRVRFTPLHVAYKDMVQRFGSSQFTVEEDLTNPVLVNGSFGYVTPITPDGFFMAFRRQNDGFVVFNDAADVRDTARVERFQQSFAVGEEMQWMDNVFRHLYANDRTAVYHDVYYLQLDPLRLDRFTGIAPKIEYRWQFPWYFIPVWSGVTLIHDDGRIEDLPLEQAQRDVRLRGKLIYPRSLALKRVAVQIYDRGYWSGWINREGKIEIPKLPGDNQMPFYVVAKDSTQYYVVAAEPAGQSYALFRMYYVDAHTGEGFVHEFDVSAGLLGPEVAIERAKAIPGYKWVEKTSDGEVGDFWVIEPVYLVRNDELYWKYTITTKNFAQIVETVAVRAHSTSGELPLRFATRAIFDRWLRGEDVPRPAATTAAPNVSRAERDTTNDLATIRALLREALERLDRLEQRR
ncbi:hypothetical protein HY480_01800, partial [Candidatus Uhrbacteria bacterium]|nr:hypothetical protein [Candidatus Uhrbacteria bacterium]